MGIPSLFAIVLLITTWTADGDVQVISQPAATLEQCRTLGESYVKTVLADKNLQIVGMQAQCLRQYSGGNDS